MLGRDLAGDENFLARNAARAYAFADTGFVCIGLRGVKMPVAERDGGADSLRGLLVRDELRAEAQIGNGHAVREGVGFL